MKKLVVTFMLIGATLTTRATFAYDLKDIEKCSTNSLQSVLGSGIPIQSKHDENGLMVVKSSQNGLRVTIKNDLLGKDTYTIKADKGNTYVECQIKDIHNTNSKVTIARHTKQNKYSSVEDEQITHITSIRTFSAFINCLRRTNNLEAKP